MESKYSLAYYFSLSFKGDDAAFQEVSGIAKEMGVEEVACGGENRFKYRLPKGTTSQNLVLKRALLNENSQLLAWCAATLDDGLANTVQPHDVTVRLLDADGNVCLSWTFFNAYPLKYSLSEFKSQENGLVLESMELAYTYFKTASDSVAAGFEASKLFN
jgi:phage tail-like protein